LPLLSRHGCPLASGVESSHGNALVQARECDDIENSIGLAARRWHPGCDLIGLGQVPALRC
jgi:hypothetical protein